MEFLRKQGHDVLSVSEEMPHSTDQNVLSKAWNEQRVLITNDKDFGQLIFRSSQKSYGILLLRLRDECSANRVRIVRLVIESRLQQLEGRFTVAGEDGIRSHPFPNTDG